MRLRRQRVTPSEGTTAGFVQAFVRRPGACIALAYFVVVVVACAAASLIAPYPPEAQDFNSILSGPSAAHILGTDELGRDVFTRLLYGGQVTLLSAAEAVVAFIAVGVPLGLLAGYRGGWVDRVIMSVTDVVLSMPVIIILLVVAAVFTGDLPLMICLGVISAPVLIRVVRAATVAVKNELYVKAAEVVGLSRARVLQRHVLPQVLAPMLVQVTVFGASAIAVEAALGYLGLDVNPPAPSWGSMVADAATVIDQQAWLIIPTGLVIALTVIALGLVGDAVREINAERTAIFPNERSRTLREESQAQEATAGGADADAFPPASVSTLLSVRDLKISVGDSGHEITLVDNASFDLNQGETLGLVGESGCGKTMTALALIGLLPAGARVIGGRALFGGQDLMCLGTGERRKLRGAQIGLISQEPMAALDPVFTIGKQIREVLEALGSTSRRATRAAMLELLGEVRLPKPAAVADKYPHELSGGMAQRVCIAMALAGRPRLLIADEPTTALDVTVQAEILDLLRRLTQEVGMSVLLVTHDWGVVADFCERVAVMYAGQVVEVASVDEIFASPNHPYAAGLQAANPHVAGTGPLPSIPGAVPPPGEWPAGCRFADRCPYATPDCRDATVPVQVWPGGHVARCLHPERVGSERASANV